ncbi:hypothetical protein D3C85_583740 [compost metagenome]
MAGLPRRHFGNRAGVRIVKTRSSPVRGIQTPLRPIRRHHDPHQIACELCARARRPLRGPGVRRGLSRPPHPADRAHVARLDRRHGGARGRREPGQDAGPAHDRREPGRGRGHSRHAPARVGQAGRLHPGHRVVQPRHQSQPVQEHALRRGQGHHAHLRHRHDAAGGRGGGECAVQDHGGPAEGGAHAARQDQLRLVRHGQRPASGR